MTTIENIANNLFLTQHDGIKQFASHFLRHSVLFKPIESNNTHQPWSIICERTEDVPAVRQQIIFELETLLGHKIDISGGISFYTLDQLGRNFCASLSVSPDQNIASKLPKYLLKPYIDVTKQEQIVEFILNLFHFPTQGNRVLTKQILTLLDIPLPTDLSLFEIFINALHIKKKRSYKDISEIFLKQILASLQASRIVLNRFARLQTLVWDFLQFDHTVLENLSATTLPQCLFGSILWVSAPEYTFSHSAKNFKPGNFLDSLVDDFFDSISQIRKKFINTEDTIFIHQRTVLETQKNLNRQMDHVALFCASSRYEFCQKALQYTYQNHNSTCVLTSEFDANMFQIVRHDGGGNYKLLKKDFLNWKSQLSQNFFSEEISNQLETKYSEFLDTASYIENYQKLSEIAKIYSIPIRDFSDEQLDEIFYSYVAQDNFYYKPDENLSKLHKPYSFFCSNHLPEQMIILWDAPHFEKNSFATRLLNQVFTTLQSHGVDIDNPFTDKLFVNFWTHLISFGETCENFKIQFIVDSKSSLENFPIDLQNKKYLRLSNEPKDTSQTKLQPIYLKKILKPDFNEYWLKPFFDQIQISQISTTQFESYIRCPFQFFLEHHLKLKEERTETVFAIDPQALGTSVHKICELLLSRMIEKFGNDEYITQAPTIYSAVLAALNTPDIFLHAEKQTWKNVLSFLPTEEQTIFYEVIDEIFDAPTLQLSSVLFIEMRKRTFFKFLNTEINNIKSGHKYRVGIVREYPFEIKLDNITIRGRIDRIDLNQNGYEIIDYKVSQISKSEKSLCILPAEIKTLKSKALPSIQGAIYALAFGQKVFDGTSNERENRLSAFSLYRLKNINLEDNAMLTYSFDNEYRTSGVEQINHIEQALKPYATNLTNKKFFPNPLLQNQTCQYCTFQNVCPATMQGHS